MLCMTADQSMVTWMPAALAACQHAATCEMVATYCRGFGLYTESWQSCRHTEQPSGASQGSAWQPCGACCF